MVRSASFTAFGLARRSPFPTVPLPQVGVPGTVLGPGRFTPAPSRWDPRRLAPRPDEHGDPDGPGEARDDPDIHKPSLVFDVKEGRSEQVTDETFEVCRARTHLPEIRAGIVPVNELATHLVAAHEEPSRRFVHVLALSQ